MRGLQLWPSCGHLACDSIRLTDIFLTSFESIAPVILDDVAGLLSAKENDIFSNITRYFEQKISLGEYHRDG